MFYLATDVEGIFRLSGSAKRIKDLQEVFNSPDRYGKGLDWTGYTVHDAANILRRYLNQLPEPIVPLDFYDRFRDPLRGHDPRSEGDTEAQASEPVDFDHKHAVATYQRLIKDLPSLNRQLLLYILDLLAVFSSKSDQNRMTSANLAAIFQPGMLSHPSHDMAPNEYRLSQDVLIFLIENQDNFLFGMSGTAADEQTVKELESGTIRPPTGRSTLRRSASNASAGADSLRKYENIRRNISVSSKHSKSSGNVPSPGTPNSVVASGAGVHRSNTVPSKRPTGLSPRLDKSVDLSSPASSGLTPPVQSYKSSRSGSRTPPHNAGHAINAPAVESGSLATTPVFAYPRQPHIVQETKTANPPVATGRVSPEETPSIQNLPSRVASPQPVSTPTKERKLSSFFAKSPPAENERKETRQPNRLRKRQRIPGSASESAQSSTNSLQGSNVELAMATPPPHALWGRTESGNGSNVDCSHTSTPKVPTVPSRDDVTPQPNREARSSESNAQPTSDTLKVNRSRTPSLNSRSSVTDHSDFDHLDDAAKAEKKEHRRSWRFHRRSKKSSDQIGLGFPASPPPLGANPGAEFSTSSVGSSRPTKSMTNDSQQLGTDTSSSGLPSTMTAQEPDSSSSLHTSSVGNSKDPMVPMTEPEKKSFFGKFKAKVAQVKEGVKDRDADKERAKSPPPQSDLDKTASASNLPPTTRDNHPSRNASVDLVRENLNHETADAVGTPPVSSPIPTGATSPPIILEEPPSEALGQDLALKQQPSVIPEEPSEITTGHDQAPEVSVTPAAASTEVESSPSQPSTVTEIAPTVTQETTGSKPEVPQPIQSA